MINTYKSLEMHQYAIRGWIFVKDYDIDGLVFAVHCVFFYGFCGVGLSLYVMSYLCSKPSLFITATLDEEGHYVLYGLNADGNIFSESERHKLVAEYFDYLLCSNKMQYKNNEQHASENWNKNYCTLLLHNLD